MDDTDDLQAAFGAARERLSAARATLDQFGSTAGQPIDSLPADASSADPAYAAALAEYTEANEEFVRLEDQMKQRWSDGSGTPVQ